MSESKDNTCRIDVLVRLEAALAWQLSLAQASDWKRLTEGGDRIQELLAQAGGPDGCICDQCTERLKRIKDVHRKLSLTLATRKQAERINISRIGQGKKLIKTYGDSMSRR